MAGSVNKVILIGNLGRDPEVRAFPNGGRVCNLSLATSENWKDRDTGERRERTEWHRVAIYNENLIGLAERFLRKGSKVYLEGQLETRKWQDQSGADRYTTEVALRPFRGEMTFLDSASGGGGGAVSPAAPAAGAMTAARATRAGAPRPARPPAAAWMTRSRSRTARPGAGHPGGQCGRPGRRAAAHWPARGGL